MAGNSEDGKTDIEVARQVIETEAAALSALRETISESMTQAVDILMGTKGFLIVAGVGKSGHIGRKIAATLASTGTPSFFVHPTEASHGDLGMITKGSSVLAISNSGETRELRDLLIYAKREDVPVIAITAKSRSFLASQATVTLLLPKTGEACPNQLAPTSSTTMTLALGDALAVAAMARRNFTREDFGARHPGGSLGMQLQLIGEYLALRKESPNPVITEDAIFADVLKAVSEGRYGAVSVIDASGALKGVVTDGDIRRAVMGHENVQAVTARQMMNPTPVTVAPDERIGIAIQTLENRQISQIIVEEAGRPVGLVHIKDLMSEGYL
ncbi:SIS domain-containing protein [Parvularcula marina]|uniref:KpsF/GutQ family sugar-phosphate isomerase n=1 Tax=Parvularcula marina TaxID=2292771 RepID=UPI003515033A